MSRTGTDENKQANTQMDAVQQDQIARANAATAKYNADLKTLQGGGSIAPNPWADPNYLRAQTVKMDAASSGANDTAADVLNREAQRTGENTEARKATISDLARQKSRAMMTMQAGQNADDYNKYLAYEQQLLGADLAPTGVDTSLFSSATQGRDAALGNLTQIGNAGYGMWGSIIGGAAAGAGSAFQGKG